MPRFAIDHRLGRIVLPATDMDQALAKAQKLAPHSSGFHAMELPSVAAPARKMDQRRPRVDIDRRLVLVHSPAIGSFHLYTITAIGGIAKSPAERITLRDTPEEACRELGIPFAGFRAVNGMSGMRFRSAAEQVMAIWREAQRQIEKPDAKASSKTDTMKTPKKAAKPAEKKTKGDQVKKAPNKKAQKQASAKGGAEGRRLVERANATGRPDQRREPTKREGMSGLDAAAKVLEEAGVAMNAKDVFAVIQEQKLAPRMKGKTPAATLYAAMMTEANKKGMESRFVKKGPLFSFNARHQRAGS